jgi:hypothetical protein
MSSSVAVWISGCCGPPNSSVSHHSPSQRAPNLSELNSHSPVTGMVLLCCRPILADWRQKTEIVFSSSICQFTICLSIHDRIQYECGFGSETGTHVMLGFAGGIFVALRNSNRNQIWAFPLPNDLNYWQSTRCPRILKPHVPSLNLRI